MINDNDRIDHDTEVSMIVSSIKSSYNPRLFSEKMLLRYKGPDTFFVKVFGTTKDS